MTKHNRLIKHRLALSGITLLSVSLLLQGCIIGEQGGEDVSDNVSETIDETTTDALDITNSIFTEQSGDCADYSNNLEASVVDISRSMGFEANILISNTSDNCTFVSNSIPNHDFNDATARFATPAAEYALEMSVTRAPSIAASSTALSKQTEDAMFLNGVVLDILSAG